MPIVRWNGFVATGTTTDIALKPNIASSQKAENVIIVQRVNWKLIRMVGVCLYVNLFNWKIVLLVNLK